MSDRRIALALGSGGARGYAHIGAIEVLEERGYEIVAISGTSMGAVIGAARAAGQLAAYTEWARGLTQRDVIRLLDPSLRAPYGIRGEKLLARLNELVGELRIEELDIPFTAVVTDLLARKEVWFQQGPVDVAVRASIALPSFMTPVMLNGRLLADGGLMDPIPIAPLAGAQAAATIAIGLAGERRGGPALPTQESSDPHTGEERLARFRRAAAQALDRDLLRAVASRFGTARARDGEDPDPEVAPHPHVDPHAGPGVDEVGIDLDHEPPLEATEPVAAPAETVFEALPTGLRTFDVMDLSIEAMQGVLTQYRMAGYPPDLLIEVPKDACRTLDFHRAPELIELGRRLTVEALDRWEEGSAPG